MQRKTQQEKKPRSFHRWARTAVPTSRPIEDFLGDWRHDRERPRRIAVSGRDPLTGNSRLATLMI